MNWLAFDPRSYLGALIGGVVGFFAYRAGLDAGWAAPWLVGLGIGLGCALVTRERSTLRGLVLACAAGWAAALAQVSLVPVAPGAGLGEGIVGFHATLDATALTLHLLGIAAAFLLGRTSLRPGATTRVAGEGRAG